jgi:predicted transcriptional regulator
MTVAIDPEEILSRLFGSVSRARILELLIWQTGRVFYQREIMYETGLSLQPTQRELKNLFDLGIIKRRETADKVYYEIDPLSPFFKPLCEICGSVQRLSKKVSGGRVKTGHRLEKGLLDKG